MKGRRARLLRKWVARLNKNPAGTMGVGYSTVRGGYFVDVDRQAVPKTIAREIELAVYSQWQAMQRWK